MRINLSEYSVNEYGDQVVRICDEYEIYVKIYKSSEIYLKSNCFLSEYEIERITDYVKKHITIYGTLKPLDEIFDMNFKEALEYMRSGGIVSSSLGSDYKMLEEILMVKGDTTIWIEHSEQSFNFLSKLKYRKN